MINAQFNPLLPERELEALLQSAIVDHKLAVVVRDSNGEHLGPWSAIDTIVDDSGTIYIVISDRRGQTKYSSHNIIAAPAA
jgi:hypothetical protein